MPRFATPRIGLVGLLQVDWMKLVTRKFSEELMKTRKNCNLSKASLVVHSGRQTSLSRLFPLLVTVTPATCSTCGRTCASHIGLYVIKDVVDNIRHIDDSVHHHHHHVPLPPPSPPWLAVWCSGNALVSINAVALHRARSYWDGWLLSGR